MTDNFLNSLKTLLIDSLDSKKLDKIKVQDSDETEVEAEPSLVYCNAPSDEAIRVFSQDERDKLEVSSRNALCFAESIGMLEPVDREAVIDELMQYDTDTVETEDVNYLLLSRADSNLSIEQMQFLDFVLNHYDNTPH